MSCAKSRADAAQEEATRALITRLGAESWEVAARIVDAVRQNSFWVSTHEGSIDWVETRNGLFGRLEAPSIATLDSLPARKSR